MKKLIITVLMMGFVSQGAFGSSQGYRQDKKRKLLRNNTHTRVKSSNDIFALNRELKRLCGQKTFDKHKDDAIINAFANIKKAIIDKDPTLNENKNKSDMSYAYMNFISYCLNVDMIDRANYYYNFLLSNYPGINIHLPIINKLLERNIQLGNYSNAKYIFDNTPNKDNI